MGMTLPPDLGEFLILLKANEVKYLLIGGYAVGYFQRQALALRIAVARNKQKQKRGQAIQLTINVSEFVPNEKAVFLIAKIEEIFLKEGVLCEIREKMQADDDPWDNLDIEEIAVDTGIEDFAENHDHYLYGTAKRL